MRFLLSIAFVLTVFLANAQSDTVTTPSGLKYVYLQKGNGAAVTPGAKVGVHYTGQFTNGQVFDTSEGGAPIKLKAGTGQVIKGWDEMLLLMRGGDEVEVIIPAALAYGNRGVPDPGQPSGFRIPPGATLKFRMKLVDVKAETEKKFKHDL
jgi:FKBP-type peptidyl-prolyl cis-trans isomerase